MSRAAARGTAGTDDDYGGMFRAAAAALLLATGCGEVTSRTADYRPEEAGTVDHALCLLGFTAVPLRELLTGHHLVELTLNDRPGAFVLDTGASATVLHAPYAARFGLSGKAGLPGGAIGLGGTMKATQVGIESMTLGGVPIRQSRIAMTDLSQLTGLLGTLSGTTIVGIVGQDVMKEHRAVIDVARPILYLIPEDRGPAPVDAARCRAPAPAKTTG